MVLVDPPFEAKDEFDRLATGFTQAFGKWPTGIYVLWYPAKSRRLTEALVNHVTEAAGGAKPPASALRLEFSVAPQVAGAALASTGLLIVNPPWKLQGELKVALTELQRPLGRSGAARFKLEAPKA